MNCSEKEVLQYVAEEDVKFVLDCIDTKNNIVLIQLLIQYGQYRDEKAPRTFAFTKYNMMKIHTETPEELEKRKSDITSAQAAVIYEKLSEMLKKNLAGKLGNLPGVSVKTAVASV